MVEQHASAMPQAANRRLWSDAGLALSIVLAVPLAMIVESLGIVMVENSARWGELAVLALFAIPLLTVWAAIALSLSSRAPWLRLSVAALLLLAPPALLFGAFNG
jgi:hypothetical protein